MVDTAHIPEGKVTFNDNNLNIPAMYCISLTTKDKGVQFYWNMLTIW